MNDGIKIAPASVSAVSSSLSTYKDLSKQTYKENKNKKLNSIQKIKTTNNHYKTAVAATESRAIAKEEVQNMKKTP